MRRREFIAGLGGAAAWPLAAGAQQPTNPTIGFLKSGLPRSPSLAAFRRGLDESGYVEGQNVAIEYRSGEGRSDALPALARELVKRAALIATYDTASALAAKAATTTIPIVFSVGADPIKIGLVTSLARPGGNITGVSFLANALGSKRLDLLRQLVPNAATFGFLVDPSNPNAKPETAEMRPRARANSMQPFQNLLRSASMRSPSPPMCFSGRGANSLPNWPFATACPRSSHFAIPLWTAA
jgi:putative ABC transport system substrate-binding protein